VTASGGRTGRGGGAGGDEEAGWLAGYRPADFPPFALTVDLAILTIRSRSLCVLLIRRGEHPYRAGWALPGGHVRHGAESAEQAAVRELREETGLTWAVDTDLDQLRTYTDPRRDPRMAAGLQVITVAFVALAADLPDPVAATDADAARWWPVDDLDLDRQATAWADQGRYDGTAPGLAFDHAVILRDARERVRAKLEYTTLATRFVPEPFSISDLRRVYTTVWGQEPEPANFRRKVLSVPGFVVPAPAAHRAPGGGGRPPALYRRGSATGVHPPLLRETPGGGTG
jgi:8-oxo-dGTP diphosphatase